MGKRNIHILIEKFFENDLSPEIQKKFHAWLLDRNFQEEKEKANPLMYILLKIINQRLV